jgi:hypothetical protein
MESVMASTDYELPALTAQHALSLRTLVGAPLQPIIAPNASKEIIVAALEAAEIDLLTTFNLIPADERDSRLVCGFWTLHDLVGHLADWDIYFLNWLGVLRGDAPKALYWDEDGDAFNQWLWQQRQGESWEKSWNDFRTNRRVLLEHLAQVATDDLLRVQPPNPYVSYPTIYNCAWSALEHFLDHAAGVRGALGLPLGQRLLRFQGPYT